MDVARQHFLAGAAFAGDQHRGLATRPPARRGCTVACMAGSRTTIAWLSPAAASRMAAISSGSGGSGRNSSRPVADRAARGLGIVAGAAGDHRHARCAPPRAARPPRPRRGPRRTAPDRRARRRAAAPARRPRCPPGRASRPRAIAMRAAWPSSPASEPMIRTPHRVMFRPQPGRVLTISVIVTPSRLSSTITTSPRATRRLLT